MSTEMAATASAGNAVLMERLAFIVATSQLLRLFSTASNVAATDAADVQRLSFRPEWYACDGAATRSLAPKAGGEKSKLAAYNAGTASTGHGAWRMTRSVVLPRNASTIPRRPEVGMQIRSASYSVAAARTVCTVLP